MQASITITINPKLTKADKLVARSVAQELGEKAALAIGSGKKEGTIEATNGSATFKAVLAPEPAPAPEPAK